jgi:hypothetical protein
MEHVSVGDDDGWIQHSFNSCNFDLMHTLAQALFNGHSFPVSFARVFAGTVLMALVHLRTPLASLFLIVPHPYLAMMAFLARVLSHD